MIPLVNIESRVDSGRLAVDYTNDTLAVWGKENSCHAGHVFDIENNKPILSFNDKFNNPSCKCSCTPYFMSKDELMVLNSENGSFDLYDLTNGNHIENVNVPGNCAVYSCIDL